MKDRAWFLLALFVAAALAGPGPLSTGIPAFLDADGDGSISEAERQAFVEARKEARGGSTPHWDTDGDGEVGEEERATAVAELQSRIDQKRSELFAGVAGDDGTLFRTQFQAEF